MFEQHFQSFDEANDRRASGARIAALREELARQELDGFVVPRADRHQGEYVPPSEERLAWLTGFPGSAGTAIVLKDKGGDLRRRALCAGRRRPGRHRHRHPSPDRPTSGPDAWIRRNLGETDKLGYDPWLTTPAQARELKRAAEAVGGTLVPVGATPRRPRLGRPAEAAARQRSCCTPRKLAGETAARKLARVAKALGKADALVVSDPHAGRLAVQHPRRRR